MATFYYGSGLTWQGYLQANSFVRDITGEIKGLSEATQAQTGKIVASNERLVSSLKDVGTSIESLRADFNYGIGLLLDQLQIQNQLVFGVLERLDVIHKTLEHPVLTQSREFYKMGCDRLSKGLLNKALEVFLKAEEKNETDFFTQFQIGKLYLYGVNEDDNVIDLPKAESHLRYAARYGIAEIAALPEFRRWAGEALLHASIACYAQANDMQNNGKSDESKEFISKAFQLTRQAIEIYPQSSENQFHHAKYAALLEDKNTSVESLEKAASSDVNYFHRTEFDRDFDTLRPQVIDLFEKMSRKNGEKALKMLQEYTSQFLTDMVYFGEETNKTKEKMSRLLSEADTKLRTSNLFDIEDSLNLLDETKHVYQDIYGKFFEIYIDQSGDSFSLSPNGNIAANRSKDKRSVRIWRTIDGKLINTLTHSGEVSFSFSPDGNIIASTNYIEGIKLWRVDDGTLLKTLNSSWNSHYISFSPDGRLLRGSLTGDDGNIMFNIWRVSDGKLLKTIIYHNNYKLWEFSPPNWNYYAFLSNDIPEFKLWRISDGKLLIQNADSYYIYFSPNGNILASPSKDHTILRIWGLSDGRLLYTLTDSNEFSFIAFSPDGNIIVSHDKYGTINLWRVTDGKLLNPLVDFNPNMIKEYNNTICFSPDGNIFAGNSKDGTINIWRSSDGELLNKLVNSYRTRIYFSPDGNIIAGYYYKNLYLWQSSDGKLLNILDNLNEYKDIFFNSDGSIIAAINEKLIKLWQTGDGRLLTTLEGHLHQFSPDFETIATDSYDKIKIWNRAVIPREKHENKIRIKEQQIEQQKQIDHLEEGKQNGLCLVCGKKLGFLDKLLGREKCSKHSSGSVT